MKSFFSRLKLPAAVVVVSMAYVGMGVSAQQIHRVKWNATGANDGTTWADAFTDLQAALGAASGGGEVWVASGTYKPGPAGNRSATFQLVGGVGVYGGFAGTEIVRAERDPAANETILSGDLGQNDTPGAYPWYSGTINYGDNAYHVVTSSGNGPGTILDGVTVYGGYSVGGTNPGGAGILVTGGAPSFRGCRIRRNYGQAGGGMLLAGGSPSVTACSFVENLVWGTYGGGLNVGDATNATIERNEFRGNVVLHAGGPEPVGGAVSIGFNSPITIDQCLFVDNKTGSTWGAPFYPAKGGAIFCFPDNVQVTRCAFVGNSSHEGGAIMSFGTIAIRECVFNKNSVVSYDYGGTSLGGWGGAVALVELFSATVTSTITGCTFVHNTATDSGGGLFTAGPVDVDLRNCIFWNNSVATANFGKAQVNGANPRWCCVQNLFVPEPGEDPFDPADVPGSFDLPPQFVDYTGANGFPGDEDDDLRLTAASPCVDAGDFASVSPGLDRDGNLRYLDGNFDGTLVTDCGAYELAFARLDTTLVSSGGQQTVTATVSASGGMTAVLAAGTPGAPSLVVPFGFVHLDTAGSYLLFPLSALPASLSWTIPQLGGIPIVLQAAIAPSSGSGAQASNPVTLVL
jgi:hypothetical protein